MAHLILGIARRVPGGIRLCGIGIGDSDINILIDLLFIDVPDLRLDITFLPEICSNSTSTTTSLFLISNFRPGPLLPWLACIQKRRGYLRQ
jgi:hypothetical protein